MVKNPSWEGFYLPKNVYRTPNKKQMAAIMLETMPYLVLISQLWDPGTSGSGHMVVTFGKDGKRPIKSSSVTFVWFLLPVQLENATSDIIGH